MILPLLFGGANIAVLVPTAFNAVEFRGTRRIRLLFTGALLPGAFTSTSFYSVTNTDSKGASPISVVAVFAIATTPSAVEIAIDSDLADGASYAITVTNVPCADTTLCSGTIVAQTGLLVQQAPNVEPVVDDLVLLLYDRDLAHDGTDFLRDGTGDLATLTGRENFRQAMLRRMTSYGLPWDPAYSPRADQYVDAPDTYRQPLAGALLAQVRQDDRAKQASVDVVQNPLDPNGWIFQMKITGRDKLDPITIGIDPPGQQ